MTYPLKFVGWGLAGKPCPGVLLASQNGPVMDVTGYNESDYWTLEGEFLGPDSFGIVPVYRDAEDRLFPICVKQYDYRA